MAHNRCFYVFFFSSCIFYREACHMHAPLGPDLGAAKSMKLRQTHRRSRADKAERHTLSRSTLKASAAADVKFHCMTLTASSALSISYCLAGASRSRARMSTV